MKRYYIAFITFTLSYNFAFTQSLDSTLRSAMFIQRAYFLDGSTDSILFKIDVKYYKKVLEGDSINYHANYGLGSLYYNEAVKYSKVLKNSNNKNETVELENKMQYYMTLSKPYMDRYLKYKSSK
jgi:hypothetical protein